MHSAVWELYAQQITRAMVEPEMPPHVVTQSIHPISWSCAIGCPSLPSFSLHDDVYPTAPAQWTVNTSALEHQGIVNFPLVVTDLLLAQLECALVLANLQQF